MFIEEGNLAYDYNVGMISECYWYSLGPHHIKFYLDNLVNKEYHRESYSERNVKSIFEFVDGGLVAETILLPRQTEGLERDE